MIIAKIAVGILFILWGLYNANSYFRKEGNRFTSALAALFGLVIGVYLIADEIIMRLN